VLTLLALTRPVAGAPSDTTAGASDHVAKGRRAFELGLFEEAIDEFMEAYRLRDTPEILYNLGQVHRLAKHPSEAIHFYKMYLAKSPGSSERTEVQAKIAALQQLVDEQKRAPSAPPSTLPAPAPAIAPRAPVAASAAPPPRRVRRPLAPGVGKQIAGVVVGVAGLGLVAGGIAYGVQAQNAGDALTRANDTMGRFDYPTQEAGKRDQLLSGVLLGIGAAAAGTGVVLYVIGHRQERGARAERHAAPAPGARF
jgi:hypothetical protein